MPEHYCYLKASCQQAQKLWLWTKVPICRLSIIAAESEAIEREDSSMSDAGVGMETAATADTNKAGNEAREWTRE